MSLKGVRFQIVKRVNSNLVSKFALQNFPLTPLYTEVMDQVYNECLEAIADIPGATAGWCKLTEVV